jgi:hypothetical protein
MRFEFSIEVVFGMVAVECPAKAPPEGSEF